MWRVLLHNDDYTTQEFVVSVLQHIFHKPQAEAFAIMLSVHQSGLGVAGVYTHDTAATKVQATTEAAEQLYKKSEAPPQGAAADANPADPNVVDAEYTVKN